MNELLFVLTALLFIGGPLVLLLAALRDAIRTGAGLGWRLALAAALLATPFIPGFPIASQGSTRWFDSPDLLTDAPRRVEVLRPPTAPWSIRRTIVEREFEGDRLIRETERVVVEFALLPLLAGGGWFITRGRRGAA